MADCRISGGGVGRRYGEWWYEEALTVVFHILIVLLSRIDLIVRTHDALQAYSTPV